jgi:hypothetical protein
MKKISEINDYYIISLLSIITHLDDTILLFTIKFVFLLALIYYIITTYFMLYVNNNQAFYRKYDDGEENKNNFNVAYISIEILLQFLLLCLLIIIYNYYETKFLMKVLYIFIVILCHSLKIPMINELKENEKDNKFNYNIYIIIWIIISLRLIKLSGSQISLVYLVNHLNLILIVNYFLLNEEKNNNLFKIIILSLLAVGYYCINSCIFIIDAIAIVISPIISKSNIDNDDRKYKCRNKEMKYRSENERVYNRLSFLFLVSIILFSLVQISYTNNFDIFKQYFKEISNNIILLLKGDEDKKIFEPKQEFEFYLLSQFL